MKNEKARRTGAGQGPRKGGGRAGGRRPTIQEQHEIVCAACGAVDRVPFVPKDPANVRCRACHQKSAEVHHPGQRAAYGTTSLHRITCARCAVEEMVSKMPRPGLPTYCAACAKDVIGIDVTGRPEQHVVACGLCGVEARMDRAPDPEKGWTCTMCRIGLQASSPERIDGTEILISKAGVRRRRG